ncbi:MAG: hypothetical protein J4F37_07545 [Acidobacteria bacterium]|nr:hypothetical protein [Acidobacteriota bacterium]
MSRGRKSLGVLAGAAVALAAAAALLWFGSQADRRLARAQQQSATLDLDGSAAALAEIAATLGGPAAWWSFAGGGDGVATRQAAVRYWQGDYAGLLADYADVAAGAAGAGPELQLIVANAAYRAGLAAGEDRDRLLRSLDGAIDAYLGVLQASDGQRDAAYNYEYLVRLRADVASGADLPAADQGQHGREGEAPEDAALEEIRIYVPVQREVDPEFDEQPTLGAGGEIRKRG